MGIDVNINVRHPMRLLAQFLDHDNAEDAVNEHDAVEWFGREGTVVRMDDVMHFSAKKDGALEVIFQNDHSIELGGNGVHVEAIGGFIPGDSE